jgi:hypothetical protein
MKKIFTLLFLSISVYGFNQTIIQSDFSTYVSGNPVGWYGSVSNINAVQVPPVSAGPAPSLRGGYAAQLVNLSSSHKRFTNVGIPVAPGNYEVKFWYLSDSISELRINFFDGSYGTYNSYKVLPPVTTTTLTFVDTLTVTTATNAGEFILSFRNTNSIGITIDSIAITKLGGTAPPPPPATYLSKTIYDIQFTTATSGDSPFKDSLVETSGIVTGIQGSKFFIQDGAGAWNGIYVYNFVSSPAVAVGDDVTIKGEVAEYFGLTQIKDIDTIIINSSGNTLPAPSMLNSTTMQDEQYEGCLVQLSGATCINPSAGFGEWDVLNATDTGVVDDLMYAYTPMMGTNYDITGIMYFSFGEYKLEPRDTNDVVASPTISLNEISNKLNLSVFPNPVSSFFNIEGVSKGTAEIMNAEGKIIRSISLNNLSIIDVSELSNGIYIIKVISENKVGFTRFIKE